MANNMYSDQSAIASFLGWSNFKVLKFWTNWDSGEVEVDNEGNGDFTTMGGVPPSTKLFFDKRQEHSYYKPLPDIKNNPELCLATIKKLMSMGIYIAPNHNGKFEVRGSDPCSVAEFSLIEDAIINVVKSLNAKK